MDLITTASLVKQLEALERADPRNFVSGARALEPSCADMRLFDGALVGVARADDALFAALEDPKAVGAHHLRPASWLPDAASVISFFLPFSEEVRHPNADPRKGAFPSASWMHGRIDGQAFIEAACKALLDTLEAAGAASVCPLFDERFEGVFNREQGRFTSNWSERHVAYVCGLGTFGLSKGLITERGMAGRFGSIVTNAQLDPTPRAYDSLYEYCSMCGACIRRCPVDAIAFEHGKADAPCCALQDEVKRVYPGFYGCGKCQVGVPCETGIPAKAASANR